MRIVLLADLQAADIGLPYELGLLGTKGQIMDDCLPEVEAKLLADGKALRETDWLKQQGGAGSNKRGAGSGSNKRGAGPKANK